MADKSGQRFIKENRAPRVHIEYEVATNNGPLLVDLPFVMGVMSDLSGKSTVEKKDIDQREFEDFSIDNFEKKMTAIKPRAAFNVANTITGAGKLHVDENRRTSLAGVWAGGDCVGIGKDLTVAAVQDGKLAAIDIDRTLRA